MELATAFNLFDKALSVLGLIRENKKQRNARIDQALTALYAALAETRLYISDLDDGRPHDRNREFAIAGLWHTASVPLRAIDSELAERCFLKGSYWMEPDVWDSKNIKAKGIAINMMFESTRDLLMKKD
ncbi:MAG: hypothetical protein WA738_14405 [Candidatus Angelobacter sp.]